MLVTYHQAGCPRVRGMVHMLDSMLIISLAASSMLIIIIIIIIITAC